MSDFDITTAKPQRDDTPIPEGVYRLRSGIKKGEHDANGQPSPGGWYRLAQSSRTWMLEFEHTVIGGECDGAFVVDYVTTGCDTRPGAKSPFPDDPSDDCTPEQKRRYETAVEIGLTRLRAMIDSANDLRPDDMSEPAQAIRKKADTAAAYDGIEFYVYVVVEEGTGKYPSKSKIRRIVTPEMRDWPGPLKPKPKADPPPPADPAAFKRERDDMNDSIPF